MASFSHSQTIRTAICRRSVRASFHYCFRSTGDPMVNVFLIYSTLDLPVCLVPSFRLYWTAQIRGESRDRGWC